LIPGTEVIQKGHNLLFSDVSIRYTIKMRKLLHHVSSSDIIAVLKQPQFTPFILSVLFSQIAFNMLNVVLIFLVYNLSNSNFMVSLVVLTALLPQIFLSFVGGVLADLKNKKKILILGNILRAIAVMLLFFYYNSLVIIFTVALVISIITQFYVPAETPFIPRLVKKNYLLSANAIFGICLFGSILIGYVFAGPLITFIGRSRIFLILSGLFIIASFCAVFIPSHLSVGNKHPLLRGRFIFSMHKLLIYEFKNSVSLLRRAHNAMGAFSLLIFSQIVILILATIIPGYAESVLNLKAEDISLIIFAPAALGMILSSLAIGSIFSKRNRMKLTNLGIFISAIVLCLFPATPHMVQYADYLTINKYLPGVLEFTKIHIAMVLSFWAGVANAFVFVPSQSTIQENTPETSRSKIYGLMFSITGVFSFIPIILAGGVADVFGVGPALLGVGLTIVLIGFLRNRSMLFARKF
jgi:MFS family permease